MSKKGKILTTISICLLLALAVGVTLFLKHRGAGEPVPEYVFLYAENQTADYPTTLGGQYFADLVNERTDGRIKILVKYGAEMGSEAEAIDQVKYGGIAFARVSLSQLAEKIPDMNVLLLPYLYDDSEHMWRVLEGEIGDEFLEKTVAYDLVGLSWYDAGARNFYSSDEPIRRLEDLKGKNIRAQESAIMSDMVSALGAHPVEVVYSEVYSALEQGIVDGAENNWPSYEAMKHYKVARYYTIDEHVRVPEMQICSGAVWDELTEEYRQIITECARESALYERRLWKEREESSKETALKNGTEIIVLSPEEKKRFRDAMKDLYEKYCGDSMDLIEKIMKY
ncbi:MAG: TRAP transporter substrate-binding protein [Lachnospiraceae bacterium]|nr:TRAP transporter substrate-binding protein [Lachnospiraceae bacterium]